MNKEIIDNLAEHLYEHNIPARMHAPIINYIIHHRETGGFLKAVISNDLKGAVGQADDENVKLLPNYVQFFYNHAPTNCWGSKESMHIWLTRPFISIGEERHE